MSRTIDTVWKAPRCGAKTRQGTPCQEPACRARRRCRKHGGRNPGGPRGNQHALKHGRYTAQAISARRQARQLLREMRALIRQLAAAG